MTQTNSAQQRPGLWTLRLIWAGQIASAIGSSMTRFAIALWIFDQTGQATALALAGVAGLAPQLLTNLFGGIIVDRFKRKHLLVLFDTVAGVTTLGLLGLLALDSLAIWHVYLATLIAAPFDALQMLAFEASISSMVSEDSYVKATAMLPLKWYGSNVAGPALAALLLPVIGLAGVMWLDVVTFVLAVAVIVASPVPQPAPDPGADPDGAGGIISQLLSGYRLIFANPFLRTLLVVNASFWFFHDISRGVWAPIILARSPDGSVTLAAVEAAAGISGVTSSLVLSVWGKGKRQLRAFLLGTASAGLAKILFGLARTPFGWVGTQLYSSLNFPVRNSAWGAIWMQAVESRRQGRVFAAVGFVNTLVALIGLTIAGPLADLVFEPLVVGQGAFAWLVGGDTGAGFSLLFFLAGIGMFASGAIGFALPALRENLAEASQRKAHRLQ